jgi:hypothetical protein
MIEISTRQTRGTFLVSQSNPRVVIELLSAFITFRFAIRDEDFELLVFQFRFLPHEIKFPTPTVEELR